MITGKTFLHHCMDCGASACAPHHRDCATHDRGDVMSGCEHYWVDVTTAGSPAGYRQRRCLRCAQVQATASDAWSEGEERIDRIAQSDASGAHYAPTAAEILRAGLGHMEDRAVTYDKPEGERSMAATVEAFKAVTGDGLVSSEERGWLFMVLLKMVRSQQGGLRMDSYEDGAAYCGLMGEAAAKERGQ